MQNPKLHIEHPLEECLELLDEPTYRFPKVSSYAIRCWGYTGSTAQSTLNLHPGVSILQHITSLSRKLFTSDLRKRIHYNKLWQYSRTTSPVLGDVGVILPLAV